MTKEQKAVAHQLTSLFENVTPKIQYGYTEYLGDGRGITCGRAGFCTGTGDAFLVVERYGEVSPGNELEKFLPALLRLNDADDPDDISELRGFISAWRRASRSDEFCRVQDEITDELYWHPSQRYAEQLGLRTPLARAFIWDTIIQHGDSDDPDGLQSLLMRANALVGGTPQTDVDEAVWLDAFIRVRRADLSFCAVESSREVWAESVERCDVFTQIAASGNWKLKTPFSVTLDGRKFRLGSLSEISS